MSAGGLSPDRLAALTGDLAGERPPLFTALATRVRLLVADGRLPVGVRLPPERDLAVQLRVSRSTVSKAYGRLREQGWATARQGSGTWTVLPSGDPPQPWVPSPAAAGLLDLAHAAPAAPPQVAAAFAAALGDLPRHLPGHGYHPGGLGELRARIAERYTLRGLPTTPEQVLVTAGALDALTTVAAVLVRPGERVLVEHPSYPNALDALVGRGAHLVPVPVEPVDPPALLRRVQAAARQASPVLAYLMPDGQNPTGTVLDEGTRRRLAAGLHPSGAVALVDESLAELVLDGPAPVPYAAGARADRVVTVGSLSKTVWGGLRVGWVRAEQELVRTLTAASVRTCMSGPVLEQLAACHLLDVLDQLAAERRTQLRVQRDALVGALRRRLPDWQVPVPAAGQVLWCGLPRPVSRALVVAARRRGLHLAPGPRFGAAPGLEDRLRLPYTQPVEVLERAARVLADAARELDDTAGEQDDLLLA